MSEGDEGAERVVAAAAAVAVAVPAEVRTQAAVARQRLVLSPSRSRVEASFLRACVEAKVVCTVMGEI